MENHVDQRGDKAKIQRSDVQKIHTVSWGDMMSGVVMKDLGTGCLHIFEF